MLTEWSSRKESRVKSCSGNLATGTRLEGGEEGGCRVYFAELPACFCNTPSDSHLNPYQSHSHKSETPQVRLNMQGGLSTIVRTHKSVAYSSNPQNNEIRNRDSLRRLDKSTATKSCSVHTQHKHKIDEPCIPPH